MTVETIQTLNFLAPYTSSADLRVLEVGCGKGDLAQLLARKVRLTALDKDESAILETLQKGVDACLLDFMEYPDGAERAESAENAENAEDAEKFDIVLFTRSLHHIHPLEAAVEKAAKVLKPSGRLILEDFAVEQADARALEWFFRTRAELSALGLLNPHSRFHSLEAALNSDLDPMTWWRTHHFETHKIATQAQMRAAIERRFIIQDETFCPYLFRYLLADLLPGVDATHVEWAIFGEEQRLCDLQQIQPIGYRLVAAKN